MKTLLTFFVLFLPHSAFGEVYKCSGWFSSHIVEINNSSGKLNGTSYPSHDQEVNSAGWNWHTIRKINKSGDDTTFLEVIQNDNGLISRVNYFTINTKIKKYKKEEKHRTELVVKNIFDKVFNLGSGYDGKCKKISN